MRRLRLLVLGLVGLAIASSLTSSGVVAAPDDVGAFRQTKSLTREFVSADSTETVDRRNVTVAVDHTKNLRGRERVSVSWTGAHPSGGRAVNPFGENGLDQEYPVVIMQCRGRDDASLPAAQRLRPETCWTSTVQQRSQRATPDGSAVWRADARAKDGDRGPLSGIGTLPASCGTGAKDFSDHVTTFVPKKGSTFTSCNDKTMAPEAAVDASFPPAETAAYTGRDGRGAASFEVRSAIENESLGCDSSTACSIVVIPIMGISCEQSSSRVLNQNCRKTGRFEPGSSNFDGQGVDDTVSSRYWWSASNWENRFSVPITFGPAPNVCDVLDDRAPFGVYGSELMTQATLQWAPAYCLRKDRFRFQHNVLPDNASFDLMQQDEVPGAFVTSRKNRPGAGPTEYAPTAVTGFAISYVIDKPENAGDYGTLRLNARLLAKLLTLSYPASELGQQHPGLGKNPLSINQDPEFRALNPGLDSRAREASAVLMSLSESSDVIAAITRYIKGDPEASAFMKGTADPWGMTINPSYRGLRLPRSEWPLLDTFRPKVSQECLIENNDTPYLTRLAAPVTAFSKISEALLDAWPFAQTKCSGLGTDQFPYVLGRGDRQGVGSRMVLGVTTIGDAARYDLRTAALQTSTVKPGKQFADAQGRRFVGPTDASLASAVRAARPTGRGLPFDLSMDRLRARQGAYPGTLVVYTAAKTSGLDRTTARTMGRFIQIATTEGQRRGSGNGFLPEGYLPIRRTGPTAALFASAQQVAVDVAAQVGQTPDGGNKGGGPAGGGGGGGSGGTDLPDDAPDDKAPGTGGPTEQDPKLQSMGETSSLSTFLGGWGVPILLLVAIGCGLAAPITRILAARKALR